MVRCMYEKEGSMNRELDGVYFRVDNEDICFSDLNLEQKQMFLNDYDKESLKRLCIILGETIKSIGDDMDIVGGV